MAREAQTSLSKLLKAFYCLALNRGLQIQLSVFLSTSACQATVASKRKCPSPWACYFCKRTPVLKVLAASMGSLEEASSLPLLQAPHSGAHPHGDSYLVPGN
jgi:hypothetical protein